MNLFPYEPTRNLLPFDGIANYYDQSDFQDHRSRRSVRDMTRHLALGATPKEAQHQNRSARSFGKIKLGGYRRDKIYCTLTRSAGKRMKVESRVFFQDENEALELGYLLR